jgi:hypothetical protein
MQLETQGIPTAEEPPSKTFAYLRSKLEAIANSGGSPLDAYDLDRFLTRRTHLFYDSYLDSAPTVESVRTLVKLGVPRWSLVNKGIFNEVFDLLRVRRQWGFASVRQARYLRDRKHPRPRSVLGTDVSGELRRLKEGRRL